MPPPRNCPATASDSANVTASPPIMMLSRNARGPPMAPRAEVARGTTRVQTSRCTLPFQFGETADVHRLEPSDDPLHQDAEDEDREDDVEGNPELDDEGHSRGHADGDQKHRVLDRQ